MLLGFNCNTFCYLAGDVSGWLQSFGEVINSDLTGLEEFGQKVPISASLQYSTTKDTERYCCLLSFFPAYLPKSHKKNDVFFDMISQPLEISCSQLNS